ncbi:DUF4184 family protein [Paenibacillus sp. sptzw28]|uniref:DUF4184 family protein n=1 Tax=Paenibacillus sp. sptzw28 TaxID=715179 RepID=UPI001C6ECCBC|nr:DUF4184 family protein [Paenibacillus sp. sptzw28]QYR19696.1 DUF4184 family protein [Paenibacillus sp. sptzw28]
MPFTFSHPLYAVPLRRIAPKWMSITGLVLGSMSPDMEYFLAMEPYRTIGHSLSGFMLLGLPLSISLAFVFHTILKPVLPKFMPAVGGFDHFVQNQLGGWKLRSWREWFVFTTSLFIGFLTHVFMDGWTHSQGGFVDIFPVLKSTIAGDGLYHWLQYLSSLIGLIVPVTQLAGRYRSWRQSTSGMTYKQVAQPDTRKWLWIFTGLIASVLFTVKLLLSGHQVGAGVWIVAPMSAFLFGWFAVSLVYIAGSRRRLSGAVRSLALIVVAIIIYKVSLIVLEQKLLSDPTLENWLEYRQSLVYAWYCFYWACSVLLIMACHSISRNKISTLGL